MVDSTTNIGEYLWPKVDRLEEYLQWAEERAALNGIIPPYKQADFSPLTEAMPTDDVDIGRSSGRDGRTKMWKKFLFPLRKTSRFVVFVLSTNYRRYQTKT